MAAIYSDNINYVGNKPNFERDRVKTLAQLLAEEPAKRRYPFGHIVFCEEDNNHYKFNYNYDDPGATSKNSVTGWFEKVIALSLSQTTGDNTGAVMSQAAVSAELKKTNNEIAEHSTVRFDRIEENEATINAGEIGSTPTAIVYYKPSNIFVAADSAGAYWDTWGGMEAYMNGGKIREDKVYLYGSSMYVYGESLVSPSDEAINELINGTPSIEISVSDFVQGYYIDSNKLGALGTPVAVEEMCYSFFDAREGEEWELYVYGGNKGRAWALIDPNKNIVDFAETTGKNTYQVVIPKGVSQILIQSYRGADYYVKRYGVKPVINLDSINTVIENSYYNGEDILSWSEAGTAYQTTVGSAFEQTNISGYICAKIENIQVGEKIKFTACGGSTVKAWAKLKDGIITVNSGGKYGDIFSGEIICDGTFDAMVFNYHTSITGAAENPPFLSVTKKKFLPDLAQKVEMQQSSINEIAGTERIKILCFGNSFTQDSMGYVPHILKNIAPNLNLTLAIAYIGGCPLVQHLASFSGEPQTLGETTYEYSDYTYYKSVDGGKWVSNGKKSPDDMLADENWDIITFQQSGGSASQDFDVYFAPFIYKLHKLLFNKTGKNIKLGWLLTQGAYANTSEKCYEQWEGTANNSKKVIYTTGTSVLFPFGTAVQNLRTTSLESLGDGNFLTADGGHLQEGIGCLTAAYANALTILGTVGMDKIGVIGEATRPDADFVETINVPGANLGTSGVIGINDANCYLAQVAAECAVKEPYAVTDLKAVEVNV